MEDYVNYFLMSVNILLVLIICKLCYNNVKIRLENERLQIENAKINDDLFALREKISYEKIKTIKDGIKKDLENARTFTEDLEKVKEEIRLLKDIEGSYLYNLSSCISSINPDFLSCCFKWFYFKRCEL